MVFVPEAAVHQLYVTFFSSGVSSLLIVGSTTCIVYDALRLIIEKQTKLNTQ